MLRAFRKILYWVIFYSGISKLANIVYRIQFNNPIAILFTHRIVDENDESVDFLKRLGFLTSKEFERKMQFLTKRFNFISLEQCIENLKAAKRVPNNIVLTFDDGYKCLYGDIFPILKKFKIQATIFLTFNYINEEKILPHDKLLYYFANVKTGYLLISEISQRKHPLFTINDRVKAFQEVSRALKYFEYSKRERIINDLFSSLTLSGSAMKKYHNLMLTWEEIREMQDSGLITFGAHTLTHPILSRVSLKTACEEILISKNKIEEMARTRVKYFAYPNGKATDFNEEIMKIIEKSGYEAAFTTEDSVNNNFTTPFKVGRLGFAREPDYYLAMEIEGIFRILRASYRI